VLAFDVPDKDGDSESDNENNSLKDAEDFHEISLGSGRSGAACRSDGVVEHGRRDKNEEDADLDEDGGDEDQVVAEGAEEDSQGEVDDEENGGTDEGSSHTLEHHTLVGEDKVTSDEDGAQAAEEAHEEDEGNFNQIVGTERRCRKEAVEERRPH